MVIRSQQKKGLKKHEMELQNLLIDEYASYKCCMVLELFILGSLKSADDILNKLRRRDFFSMDISRRHWT